MAVALCKIACQGRFSLLYRHLCSRYAVAVFSSVFLLILYSFLITVATSAYDFSRTIALISLLIGLVLTVVVYSSLSVDADDRAFMEKMIVGVFLLQALISISAFGSPAFREIVSLFQFKDDAELASESYSGIRGLAVSGRLYFEFAATCGLVVIIQMKRILDENKVSYYRLVELFLLIVCGFFAGRTSLVGLIFAFGLLLIYRPSRRMKIKFAYRFLLCLLGAVFVCIVLLPGEILEFINEVLLPWVFDVFIAVCQTGSTEQSYSFNTLNEMYETVRITTQEWIVGAGKYVNSDGSYYKHVDAGYLRQVLYWGIVGSVISFFCSLRFFARPWRMNRENRNERRFLFIVLLYTLVAHYKGDLMGISRFYYVILFICFLPMALPVKQKTQLG
ncbi:MAG: hypothetical protein NC209_00250 [Alistipes sp.]|nr:hypothetical protein [Alistipes senegalensis]MCM1249563.1 hypothetical protein [Alistipes sp.]